MAMVAITPTTVATLSRARRAVPTGDDVSISRLPATKDRQLADSTRPAGLAESREVPLGWLDLVRNVSTRPAPVARWRRRIPLGTMPSMSPQITIDRSAVADFCKRNHVQRLALFGSVLRGDFGPDSDVDVLVEFEPGPRRTGKSGQ